MALTDRTVVEPRSTHLLRAFQDVRFRTRELAEPLAPDDFMLQSMSDASPAKWHLAHTTWFFETFVLATALPSYQPFDPTYGFLFNSYYNSIGERHARPERGVLSRPTIDEVFRYRRAIDERVGALLLSGSLSPRSAHFLVIGLQHEQQHQELLLTDLKHGLSRNALYPAYRQPLRESSASSARRLGWTSYEPDVHEIGRDFPTAESLANGSESFVFDSETPRHRVFLEPFEIADRLVTCDEYLAFMEDGGYERSEFWLSDGWDICVREGWRAPLYWERGVSEWRHFTLGGLRAIDRAAPVTHVSYYEADAFASWSAARLPTEAEWEVACGDRSVEGRFVDDVLEEETLLHPGAVADGDAAGGQFFGDAWEWTQSSYSPYPGYRREAGALGEYNGKFMCNQYVLRGGSCASSRSHLRASYRNFFYPNARWQFSGIRLAKSPRGGESTR